MGEEEKTIDESEGAISMKNIRTYCLVFGFTAIMLMPALLKNLAPDSALSGVTLSSALPDMSKKELLNGRLQESLNTYYAEHLPGRDFMINIRNQVIFSLFHQSPNELIILGKDKVLFEEEYVLKYEKYYPPATREYTEDLCEKLVRLQDLLSARGKEMYIFITPTKVRYYEEFVPDIYRQNNRFPDEPGNYEQFTDTLKNYPLHVYDSIPWINERAKTADFPLFYRTGTHWSWVLGMEVAADFARYLNEESRFTFPQANVAYQPTEEPVHPDADIFKLLNLFSKPYDEVYFQAEFLSEPRTDEGPNLFCRGGSFMEQTISPLIRNGYFKQDTYVQNTMIYRNCFSELTEFSDYAEMDLKQEIDQADIILLEVNEAHIPVMSFSLIDYLLERPEILSE